MTSQNYREVLDAAVSRYGELVAQQQNLEVEITKIRQFIAAAVHMLSDEEQQSFWQRVAQGSQNFDVRQSSLAESIRDVLCNFPKNWFTVAQVRDKLKAANFDFDNYASNPLASVSTTLKRFSSKEVERTEIDGVAAYRWKSTKSAKERLRKKQWERAIEQLFGINAGTLIPAVPPMGEMPRKTFEQQIAEVVDAAPTEEGTGNIPDVEKSDQV